MIDSVGQSGWTGDEINYRLLHSQGGMGSGLFIRGRCHSLLQEVKLEAPAVLVSQYPP